MTTGTHRRTRVLHSSSVVARRISEFCLLRPASEMICGRGISNRCRLEEDLAERQGSRCETGLHGRRSQLGSESQTAMWPGEVLVASDQFKVLYEAFLAARMGGSLPRQVGRAGSSGEIESFHQRGVELPGSLRIRGGVLRVGLLFRSRVLAQFGRRGCCATT